MCETYSYYWCNMIHVIFMFISLDFECNFWFGFCLCMMVVVFYCFGSKQSHIGPCWAVIVVRSSFIIMFPMLNIILFSAFILYAHHHLSFSSQ